jgi:hypothetical protein
VNELLQQILNQLKAMTLALVSLDSTNQSVDYVAEKFDGVEPMQ